MSGRRTFGHRFKRTEAIYESARINPAAVQVEAHPYLPQAELLGFCKEKGIMFLAFAPLGHEMRPGPLEDPVISAIAARVERRCQAKENFDISALPEEALDEINRIQTRQRAE